jgi:type I restriction enzyme, R subunit
MRTASERSRASWAAAGQRCWTSPSRCAAVGADVRGPGAVMTDNHAVYVALSERLERLRHRQLSQASASVEFLREILELAQQVTAVERADDSGDLDSVSVLPDPNVGALTQIFREYAPPDVPVIIENVVTDIDTIVRQVRFTGWTQTQNGDRTVRREIRLILKKYGLPSTGDLFDHAYAYIRENY